MQFTLSELWGHMGVFARGIVVVMGILGLASVAVFAERVLAYMKSNNESKAFASKMGPVLASGDLDAAASMKLGADVGHLGRVIGAGLSAYKSSVGAHRDLVFESVSRALERQSAREVAVFKRGHSILATVGSTTPFIGLLGTVMGIVNSFQSMAASGSGGLGTVSAGIAEALITTAFGLLVAIPAVMAFNGLSSWVDARAIDISESSNEFLDVVSKQLEAKRAEAA